MTFSRLRFRRASFITTSALALYAALSGGCDTGDTNTNPRPSCPPGAGTECVGPTGGGSNPTGGASSSSGGEGGGATTNDVAGNVGVLIDSGFSQAAPFNGATTIHTTSTAGAAIEAPYGDMITFFTLADVMTGPTWFFVEDQSLGATGIYSTYSVVNVPASGSVTLPVVDRNLINSIAGMLPSPIVIDSTRGVLILKVIRNGQPLAGVSLTTIPAGATLAYDTGVGLYSNQVQGTGPAGVIVAFNVLGPSDPELQKLQLQDINQQTFFVDVQLQEGAATFAGFAL